jgi:uroporphyrinogen-III synthase
MAEPSLRGRRVIVTRTRDNAAGLVDALHDLGADVVVVPLIATVPIATPGEVADALAALSRPAPPRWVVFTSATAVRLVLPIAGDELASVASVAAVGPDTADALREGGIPVELVAAEHAADGLAGELVARGMAGAVVWLPQAEGSRPVLANRLREAGADVRVTVLYRSEMPAGAPERLARALESSVDAIMLTSSSTAENLSRALAGRQLDPRAAVVCIGEQTAEAARRCGIDVAAVARRSSRAGLIEALIGCLGARHPVP